MENIPICPYLTITSCRTTLAALLYAVCSISMAFVNKSLLSTMEFDYPVFVMSCQMLFTILLLELLKVFRILNFPAYNLERGKSFALPAFFYGLNSILALSALGHMNIAMYGVLKRCVPLVTLVMSVLVFKKPLPSRHTIASVLLLTLGCIIAGYGDLSFNIGAYLAASLSNLTQTFYLLLVQQFGEKKMGVVETLQLNSYNTFPLLLSLCCLNGELFSVKYYKYAFDLSFICLFILTLGLGCLLNYSLFLCTCYTSALTTSVVGGLKALAQTGIGLVTFGGVSYNFPTFFGISLNLTGGLFYIFVKYTEGDKHGGHKSLSNQQLNKVDEQKLDVVVEPIHVPNGILKSGS